MAYSSEIKLEIGEVPKTDDPALLPDMLDLFNSIHILTQWVNQLIKVREEDNSEDKPPEELKPLTKSMDALVGEDVLAGQFVWPTRDNDWDSWRLGAPIYAPPSEANPNGTNLTGRVPVGVVMKDGLAWSRVPIALGPGIMKVEGVVLGQAYYLSNDNITRGYLNTNARNSPPVPIAWGIGDGYVLVFDSLAW